jgi:hypothetical protein
MLSNSAKRIAGIIPEMRKKIKGKLGDFLDLTLQKYLSNIGDTMVHSINETDYNNDLKIFYNEMKDEIYSSFLKSLTFTASRIPA